MDVLGLCVVCLEVFSRGSVYCDGHLVDLDSLSDLDGVWVYNSKANRAFIKRKGLKPRINQGKPKGKPMPKAVARANAKRSSVRARVEHVFAHMKNCYGLFICTIGLARATTKLKLACLAYNFDWLIFLERRRRCMEESI